MASTSTLAAFTALCASIGALYLFYFLDKKPGAWATTSARAPPLDGAALLVLLPLAAMVALCTAIGSIYHRLHHADAARRRLSVSELAIFAAIGILYFLLFPSPSGGTDGGGKQARALGTVALGALPASATATFFLGMTLIIEHVRAGGSGNRPVTTPVKIMTKMTLAAAAALLAQMTMALCAATC